MFMIIRMIPGALFVLISRLYSARLVIALMHKQQKVYFQYAENKKPIVLFLSRKQSPQPLVFACADSH